MFLLGKRAKTKTFKYSILSKSVVYSPRTKTLKNFMAPFSVALKATAISRRQFTFYH